MARGLGRRASKKQKLSSGTNGSPKKRASKTSKIRKAKHIRQVSSELSSVDGRRQKPSQTFHQPLPDSQSVGRQPGRSTAAYEDIDDEPGEEDEEEDIPEGSADSRYKSIGKAFALKVWPWPSPNWWIGDEVVTMPLDDATGTRMKDKLARAKGRLDIIKKAEFTTFLGLEMGISTEEWKTKKFRSEVTIPFVILSPVLMTI